jgi:hypothetical protein
VDFVLRRINLPQQLLQVDAPTGAGGGDDKFHPIKISTFVEDRLEFEFNSERAQ